MRTTPQLLALAAFGLAALLVACSTGAPPVPEPGPNAGAVRATVRVKFPRPRRGRGSPRDPRYVSAATTSVKFTLASVNGKAVPAGFTATKTVTLSYHATNASCTYASATQSYTCSTAWVVPAASDAFVVDAYDASSNLLSTNALSQVVAKGSSTIAVTLWGVPAAVTIATTDASILGTAALGYTLPVGAASYPFTVQATDADGYSIVGPGAPSYSASLSSTADFSLTTPAPSATSFTVKSLGATAYQDVTLTLTAAYPATGATPYPTSCPAASCSAKVQLAAGEPLFAANGGYTSGAIFAYGAQSVASALATATAVPAVGSLTTQSEPFPLTVDTKGDLYVIDDIQSEVHGYASSEVLASVGGTVSGPSGTFAVASPEALAIDASGDLFATSYAGSTVDVFAASAVNSVLAGTAGVAATGTLLAGSNPNQILVSGGVAYIVNSTSKTVGVYKAASVTSAIGGSKNVAATGTLATGNGPVSLALDSAGNLYVLNNGDTTVSVFLKSALTSALAGSANVAAAGTLKAGSYPFSLIFDKSGDLLVENSTGYDVSVYAPSALAKAQTGSANVAATGSLAVVFPGEMAVDSAGDVAVADLNESSVYMFSAAAVASAASGTANVAATGSLYMTGGSGVGGGSVAFYP